MDFVAKSLVLTAAHKEKNSWHDLLVSMAAPSGAAP